MTLRQTLHKIQVWELCAKMVPLYFLTYFGLGFSPSNIYYSMIFFVEGNCWGVVAEFFFTIKAMEGWVECRGGRPITTVDGRASRFQCGAPARSKFCRNAIQPQHGFGLEHD